MYTEYSQGRSAVNRSFAEGLARPGRERLTSFIDTPAETHRRVEVHSLSGSVRLKQLPRLVHELADHPHARSIVELDEQDHERQLALPARQHRRVQHGPPHDAPLSAHGGANGVRCLAGPAQPPGVPGPPAAVA